MSVDLMKSRKDLAKIRGIIKEYTIIFKASDGIGSEEQAELNQMQDKVDLIEETALTNEFERAFWAGWLPRLKNEKTRTHTGRDEFGVADPNYGETYNEVSFDTWFSSTLKNRLYALIDMKSIGVGDGGLGWVSVADVKLLIAWANKFTFTQTF